MKGKYDAGFFGKGSFDVSSFFSLVVKDQDMYVLLRDVAAKIEDLGLEQKDIDIAVKAINEFFAENTYLKISQETTGGNQEIAELLQGASLRKIVQNMFDEPLFQAYTKSGNAYVLIPSKHACNLIIGINKKGPLGVSNGYTCGQYEYETFVKEFIKLGTMTLAFDGKLSTWAFKAQGTIDSDISISYNEDGIQKISYVLTPDQKIYPGDGADFSYQKGKDIKFHLKDATMGYVMYQ